MEMVSKAEQADALQAIALIETLAMTLTVSVFGAIFAELSKVGKAFDVFFINSVSFLSFSLSRFSQSKNCANLIETTF